MIKNEDMAFICLPMLYVALLFGLAGFGVITVLLTVDAMILSTL